MMNRIVPATLFLAGTSLLPVDGHADSLGCDGRIVASGDSRYRVRSICGEPDEAVRRTEVRTERQRVPVPCPTETKVRPCSTVIERSTEIVIDEWTYDFGRERFVQHLTFEQGRLVSVAAGAYGAK